MPAIEPAIGEIPRRLGIDVYPCAEKADYDRLLDDPAMQQRIRFERALAAELPEDGAWLHGFCHACDKPTEFRVDPREAHEWRENQTCRHCQLIARHRLAFSYVTEVLRGTAGDGAGIYVLEQDTALFRALRERHTGVVGSEYLGDGIRGGKVRGGIRHEDAGALSFADATFDLVMSNDVLEHVPAPEQTLAEMARVLRPGGRLFATLPFRYLRETNTTRATMRDGHIEHIETPEYHGDPLSGGRSLVFTDFGWELLGQLAAAGFAEPRVVVYWSYAFGQLGFPASYIEAVR